MKKRLSKMAALVSALALLFTTIACDLPSAKDPTQEETQTQENAPTQEAPTPVLKPAATPTITVENNTVTITSTTKNAKIYYTVDGTAPSTESTEYTKAFEITARTTVKAIATAEGFDKSEVATKECEYVMPVTANPVIKNTDNSITITCETEAAVIYYTTDGTAPTTESTKYTEAFTITADTTVQAFASAEGFAASEIVKEELEYVAPGSVGTPKIEQTGNTVKISCPTSGASIYYTDDGSAPSASSKPYTSEITLTKTLTIKAIAVKAECTDSTVTSKECPYTAPKAEKPVIAVSDNKVTITAEDFDIYYTTDGSEPSSESTKYTAAFDITAETTVKAIAVKEGYTNSDIAEKACSYVAPTPAPTPTPTPTPEPAAGGEETVSNPQILMETPTELAWDAIGTNLDSSVFSSATNNQKIIITYKRGTNTDYHKFKIGINDVTSQELFEGTCENFTIDTTSENPDDLHGCSFTATPSLTPAVLSYTPSETEWSRIKEGGFKIYGYGARILSIVLDNKTVEITPYVPESESTEPTNNNINDSITLVINQNRYKDEGAAEETNHGLSLRCLVEDLGIELEPAENEIYTIHMKGTATDYTHLSNMCIGFETDYDWNNCAMVGGKSFTAETLSAGIDIEVSFNGIATGSWYFWFYDDSKDPMADSVTMTLSEFSITKNN